MRDENDRIFRAGERMDLDDEPRMTRAPMIEEKEMKRGEQIQQRSVNNSQGGPIAVIFVIIGVALIFFGVFFGSIHTVIERPDRDDYDDSEYEEYEKDVETYDRVMRWFSFTNEILLVGGALVLASGLMGYALISKHLHPNTKIGLLIGAALIIGFMLISKNWLANYLLTMYR
jgi:hypothetical protein